MIEEGFECGKSRAYFGFKRSFWLLCPMETVEVGTPLRRPGSSGLGQVFSCLDNAGGERRNILKVEPVGFSDGCGR